MKRQRMRWVCIALLVLAGLAACSRGGEDDATHTLTISGVYAEASRVGDGLPTMEVDGVITNNSGVAVQLDELPKLMQDDAEMKTEYEFPYEDSSKIDPKLSVTFHATAEFDPSLSHEWRFEPAEDTKVEGLDEAAKMTEALHAYLKTAEEDTTTTAGDKGSADPGDAYTLQEVVVLSRHSIRAPLSDTGSVLDLATPNTWTTWTAKGSELTLRGGAAETLMGQYMRTWLEAEGLIPQNYQPAPGEVRFYANSLQRTIATAQYFSSGMLPVANVSIDTNGAYDEMDPIFTPAFTFASDAYTKAALAEIAEQGGKSGMEGVTADLTDAYALIEEVIDYRNSEGYTSGELTDFSTSDTKVSIALGEEPTMGGSLKDVRSLADALILQYYETPEAGEEAFGHPLTEEEWKRIGAVSNRYNDLLFSSPLVATNIAHPLLEELGRELDLKSRKFTFLCGHDSNIVSVLAALGVAPYELPETIETHTPIGGFIAFEKWAKGDGELYGRLRYVYQTTAQLRDLTLLENGEEPMSVALDLEGLEKNEDGLYTYADLRGRISDATAAYYELRTTYADEADETALPDAA